MSKIINGTAMIQRVKGLYESGKVDLSYYLIVKEAVQMEPAYDAISDSAEECGSSST